MQAVIIQWVLLRGFCVVAGIAKKPLVHMPWQDWNPNLCAACCVQDPLTLLLLGPTATGAPGLLGVATLLLHIEDAQQDFSNTCHSRAQPLPLISPAGEQIGCVTAAARVVCCQPGVREQPSSPVSQYSVCSTRARMPSSTESSPAALQALGHHAHHPALSSPAEESTSPLRMVSAAVQTDAPQTQDTSSASSQPLHKQVLEAQASAAAANTGSDKDAACSQPPPVSYVMQSPHFHIYPPAPQTVPTAPLELRPAPHPQVISIAQPTFNFLGDTSVQATSPGAALSQADAVQAQAAPVTNGTEQPLQQLPGQGPLPPISANDKACQAADASGSQMGQAADDFESWRPVTFIPFSRSTAATAAEYVCHSQDTVSEANAKSVWSGQYCSGAHALTLRPTSPCHHQVLHCCACAMHVLQCGLSYTGKQR